MNIKGEYRDILTENGEAVADMGWRSNTIVPDFGRFLAALMKRDFNEKVLERSGTDYIAFGSGSVTADEFKRKIVTLFKEIPNLGKPFKSEESNYWVWAKKIDKSSIRYMDDTTPGESKIPTNMIKIEVVVDENEPPNEDLIFKEFGLFGIDRKDDGSPDPEKIFFINYVSHMPIGKLRTTKLSRTILLKFL